MSSTYTVEKTPPVHREPRVLVEEANQKIAPTYRVKLSRYQDPKYFPALFIAYIVGAAVFAAWRTFVVDWTVWFGPVSWAADMFGLAMSLLFFGILRRSDLPESRMTDPVTRTVDILIPTVNEELAVVEPTVIGAMNVAGVRDVLVLDDGGRPEIRAMAQRWGARYIRREGRAGAKAGNLNNALRFTDAGFVVTLDADHIPLPDFLRWTIGYFDDPSVAFVQTPQSFYNTDSLTFRRRRGGAATWHEQDMFYGAVQPSKNRGNSAFYTGTGAVLRRSAIDSIGGFAVGSVTEDIHTSIRLHSRGWHSLYLRKPLSYGLEVDNLREFYRTRRRWAVGSIGLLFRSADSPLRVPGLSLGQRLSYLSSMTAHLQGVHRFVLLGTPLAAVASGVSPVRSSYPIFGLVSLGFIGLSCFVTTRLGRGHFHLLHNEMFSLAAAPPMVAGLWGALRGDRRFEVSRKRAGRTAGGSVTLTYWAVAVVCAIGVAWSLVRLSRGENMAISTWAGTFLLVNLGILAVFLRSVRRDERRAELPDFASLPPIGLYRQVCDRANLNGRSGTPGLPTPSESPTVGGAVTGGAQGVVRGWRRRCGPV